MQENFGLSKKSQPYLPSDGKKADVPYYPPCDSCIAKSAWEVVLLAGHPELTLYFCKRHFKKHEVKLLECDYEVEEL